MLLNKKHIESELNIHFAFADKIYYENLIRLLTLKNYPRYNFFVREVVTDGDFQPVCSIIVSVDDHTRLTVDFSTFPFSLSTHSTLPEVVDKLYKITLKADYIRQKFAPYCQEPY